MGIASQIGMITAMALSVFMIGGLWYSKLLFGQPASLHLSLHNGLMIGFFFVFTSVGINYQFANRPWPMLLIDGGYHLLQFAAYGLIAGLWPH